MYYAKSLNISLIKRMVTLVIMSVAISVLFAQNTSKGDTHTSGQTVVKKSEGNQSGWIKIENDIAPGIAAPPSGNENVSFTGTSDGIYITINNGTNKIKLFALTGQLLLNVDSSKGRFFIPTRKGIYFLEINNKSYKVICK